MFIWCNQLRTIHLIMLIACSYFFLQFPVTNEYSNKLMESLSSYHVESSMLYNLFEQVSASKYSYRNWKNKSIIQSNIFIICFFTGRCSSSSLISIENIHSYTSMNMLVILLYIGSVLLILLVQLLYSYVSREQLLKPYRWFCWCRKIFICLVVVSIFHQLVNALACRSIDVLYDFRYISIFTIQITGFVICLLFAFFLGIKYGTIKHKY